MRPTSTTVSTAGVVGTADVLAPAPGWPGSSSLPLHALSVRPSARLRARPRARAGASGPAT